MRKRMNVKLTKDFPIPDTDIIFEPGDEITIEYDDGSPDVKPAESTPDTEDGAAAEVTSEPEPVEPDKDAYEVVDKEEDEDEDEDNDDYEKVEKPESDDYDVVEK